MAAAAGVYVDSDAESVDSASASLDTLSITSESSGSVGGAKISKVSKLVTGSVGGGKKYGGQDGSPQSPWNHTGVITTPQAPWNHHHPGITLESRLTTPTHP